MADLTTTKETTRSISRRPIDVSLPALTNDLEPNSTRQGIVLITSSGNLLDAPIFVAPGEQVAFGVRIFSGSPPSGNNTIRIFPIGANLSDLSNAMEYAGVTITSDTDKTQFVYEWTVTGQANQVSVGGDPENIDTNGTFMQLRAEVGGSSPSITVRISYFVHPINS